MTAYLGLCSLEIHRRSDINAQKQRWHAQRETNINYRSLIRLINLPHLANIPYSQCKNQHQALPFKNKQLCHCCL